MIKIRGLDHLVLRVVDMERSLAFYCDLLGCAIERRVPDVGLIQLRAGRSLIDLVPRRSDGPPHGGDLDHFCLRLETFDAQALTQLLTQAGVPVEAVESRYGAEGFGPSLYIKDPDGIRVELKGGPPET
ncbi:VOC family protein [Motiliproteus sp. SC1-56]|uniref:VOC family protein n=1 Tax=Motiliproteus sp. SC1-56 TaxID=2799565 RepID=UPI001A8CA65E|nr:VOC family protein [Motiliproteus sp. SC1-56]